MELISSKIVLISSKMELISSKIKLISSKIELISIKIKFISSKIDFISSQVARKTLQVLTVFMRYLYLQHRNNTECMINRRFMGSFLSSYPFSGYFYIFLLYFFHTIQTGHIF